MVGLLVAREFRNDEKGEAEPQRHASLFRSYEFRRASREDSHLVFDTPPHI